MEDAKHGTLKTNGLSHVQMGHTDEPRHTKTAQNQLNETECHTAQGKRASDAPQTRTDPIRHTLEAFRPCRDTIELTQWPCRSLDYVSSLTKKYTLALDDQ
jgi:hypothetical protein